MNTVSKEQAALSKRPITLAAVVLTILLVAFGYFTKLKTDPNQVNQECMNDNIFWHMIIT